MVCVSLCTSARAGGSCTSPHNLRDATDAATHKTIDTAVHFSVDIVFFRGAHRIFFICD